MSRKLYWNVEEGNGYLSVYHDTCIDESREAKDEEITLKGLADLLDQRAESINAHAFVCTHRGLACLLTREIGEDAAKKIFLKLYEYDGLQGMVGYAGAGDGEAEKDLGVSLSDWSAWDLPSKPQGRSLWGLMWQSGRNGEHKRLVYEKGIPLLFETRKKARDYATDEFGYIRRRPDLQAAPHWWRMPKAVRVRIDVVEVK